VVPINHWYPGLPPGHEEAALLAYAALGRKPAQAPQKQPG
jgi:hypothetical protein